MPLCAVRLLGAEAALSRAQCTSRYNHGHENSEEAEAFANRNKFDIAPRALGSKPTKRDTVSP